MKALDLIRADADANTKWAEDLRTKVTFRRTGPLKFDWVVEIKPHEWYDILSRNGIIIAGAELQEESKDV